MALAALLFAAGAEAHPGRQQFTVATPRGPVLVESLGQCATPPCPAAVILSGSKGFAAPAYDDIGRTVQAAGVNAFLVHVLSATDLEAIARAGGARERIAFYARRLPDWVSEVRSVIASLRSQAGHPGKIGVLGISLGAEIASAAAIGDADVGALVLVDGALPAGFPEPAPPWPALLLIWGSADRTFPPSLGRTLQQRGQRLGGSAALDVYEGGAHDFFLQADNPTASAAHRDAATFLATRLSQ